MRQYLVRLSRNLNAFNKIGGVRVRTACSGTEIQEFVGRAIFDAMNLGPKYRTVSACDTNPKIRHFIQKMVFNESDDSPDARCIFDEIQDLHLNPYCTVHKSRGCKQEKGHISIICCSCKELSKYSKLYLYNKTCLRDCTGSSGKTFKGLKDHLAEDQPPLYIGENVEDLDSVNSENRSELLSVFGQAGYVVDSRLLKHSDYDGKSIRKRAFIVALNLAKCSLSHHEGLKLLGEMFNLVHRLKSIGVCFFT